MKTLHKLALALIGSAFALNASAGTAVGNITLSGTVIPNCVVTAGGSFTLDATYDAITTNASTDASFTNPNAFQVNCTKGLAANIAIVDGTDDIGTDRYASGTGGNTDKLHYILYFDSVGGSAWGDKGSSGASALELPFNGTGVAQNVALYASIPAGQAVQADTYSETLQVKVYF